MIPLHRLTDFVVSLRTKIMQWPALFGFRKKGHVKAVGVESHGRFQLGRSHGDLRLALKESYLSREVHGWEVACWKRNGK